VEKEVINELEEGIVALSEGMLTYRLALKQKRKEVNKPLCLPRSENIKRTLTSKEVS
jgi:hypothetical protein